MDFVLLDKSNHADVEGWLSLSFESQRTDFPADPRPSRRVMVGRLDNPFPGQRTERWLAKEDGHVIGAAHLSLPDLDNRELGDAYVLVSPRHRRAGVGRALFEHLVARGRAEGRVRFIGEVREPLPDRSSAETPGAQDPPGVAFSKALGAKRVLDEVRYRLHVDRIDTTTLAGLEREAAGASPGYRLVRWNDHAPDDLIDDVAVVESRMSTDPPMGDLQWEPEVIDAERFRGIEAMLRTRGSRVHCSGVVESESGRLVGYTMATVDEDVPEAAWQGATIVAPEHRGHRLGLRLKVANLSWLRLGEPALRTVDTGVAADNTHMIAVNDALGFVAIELEAEWQVDI